MLVSPDFCRLMARYNAWQNAGLLALVPTLPPADLLADRGAFWGGVLGTLNHLLYGDRIWLHRLAGQPRPEGMLATSATLMPDAAAWAAGRVETDDALTAYAAALLPADLDGNLAWDSPAAGRRVVRPRAEIVVHLFNHQTHHRGQAHALLTALGHRLPPTDLAFMPE